jgi:hypothetical protein
LAYCVPNSGRGLGDPHPAGYGRGFFRECVATIGYRFLIAEETVEKSEIFIIIMKIT